MRDEEKGVGAIQKEIVPLFSFLRSFFFVLYFFVFFYFVLLLLCQTLEECLPIRDVAV